jgi:hypothetical protein
VYLPFDEMRPWSALSSCTKMLTILRPDKQTKKKIILFACPQQRQGKRNVLVRVSSRTKAFKPFPMVAIPDTFSSKEKSPYLSLFAYDGGTLIFLISPYFLVVG